MLEALIAIASFAAVLALAYWYIEVYTPRKHMREAIAEANAIMGRHRPRPAAQPADPLDTPLPCDVQVGGNTFRKGVSLSTFVTAARAWHREAFPEGYALTAGQKAENLRQLQSLAHGVPPIDQGRAE